jgi:hypothetical protein
MTGNGLVTPVVDGSGAHNRFGDAEDVLDLPECFVDVNDCLGLATIFYRDFLDFKRRWIFGVAALRNTFKPWIFAAEAPTD